MSGEILRNGFWLGDRLVAVQTTPADGGLLRGQSETGMMKAGLDAVQARLVCGPARHETAARRRIIVAPDLWSAPIP